MNQIRIGWASRDVSTDKPVNIPGQFHMRISEGVLDPVTVNALVLDAWDSRGTQSADKAFADNPAFRRRLNQLKLTEPVRSESDTEG